MRGRTDPVITGSFRVMRPESADDHKRLRPFSSGCYQIVTSHYW
jgi:hypothetical protein